MRQKRKMVIVCMVALVLAIVMISSRTVPTANVVNDNSHTLDIAKTQSSDKKNNGEAASEKESSLATEQNTEQIPEEKSTLGSYGESIDKIKENYQEIEKEIERLEQIKKGLKEEDKISTQTIQRLKQEIEKMDPLPSKQSSLPFYVSMVTINILALYAIFFFTKNNGSMVQIPLKKENRYLDLSAKYN